MMIIIYLVIGIILSTVCVAINTLLTGNDIDDSDATIMVMFSIILWPVFLLIAAAVSVCWAVGRTGRWLGRRLRR